MPYVLEACWSPHDMLKDDEGALIIYPNWSLMSSILWQQEHASTINTFQHKLAWHSEHNGIQHGTHALHNVAAHHLLNFSF